MSAMTTVRLSSSSGDRLTARKTEPPLRGARRNLFGPVDHDELNREMKLKLKEISEGDQLRWNFNFTAGQPLEGEFHWEESPAEDCPAFYLERSRTAVSMKPNVELPTTIRFERAGAQCGGRSAAVKVLNREKHTRNSGKPNTTARTKRVRELRITDFYGKRRKTGNVILKESRITV